MNDRVAFLQAICADPADDTPRLVYADWLDDHGEPERAEFIRVQVELATIPGDPQFPHPLDSKLSLERKRLLARRSLELHRAFSPRWFDRLAGQYRSTHPDMTIRSADGWQYLLARGFVSQVTCSAADWLAHADAIAWRPGWKTECGSCGGDGLLRENKEWGCHDCGGNGHLSGTGRVPRPFPPTAQPIEFVRLTTWPNNLNLYWGPGAYGLNISMRHRWEGVPIALPYGVPGSTVRIDTGVG